MDLFKDTDFYTVKKLTDHDEWLKERTSGIGGSDAAALCDCSRFKTLQELWFDKIKGQRKPVGGPAVDYGTTCEDPLRRLYAAKHLDQDVQHMENVTLISKETPWRKYSPDGLIYIPETGQRGILEIKTSLVSNGKKAAEWETGIPHEYFCQILHGLLVTGFDFVTLTAELRKWDGSVEIVERSWTRESVANELSALDLLERINYEKYFEAKQMPPLRIGI